MYNNSYAILSQRPLIPPILTNRPSIHPSAMLLQHPTSHRALHMFLFLRFLVGSNQPTTFPVTGRGCGRRQGPHQDGGVHLEDDNEAH